MKPCPKCFEQNEDNAEFCSECGTTLKAGADGSDQEVYTELAQANLLRTRGEFKAASDVCLSILRRYPNNPTAHSLLGDISADQGDLVQAQTWYEMTLDLVPNSANEKQKLDEVKNRIARAESAEAASIIGIPEKTPNTFPYLLAVVITVLLVGAGAFAFGRFWPSPAKTTVETPISLSVQPPEPTHVDPPATEAVNNPSVEKPVPTESALTSDLAIVQALQSKGTEKLDYITATNDPRGPTATITVRIDKEQPALVATRAGLEFFRVFPAFSKVTVRLCANQAVVFVADMTRDAAKTAEAAIAGGDSLESQSQVMLIQVWSPQQRLETPPTGSGPSPK